MNKFIKYAALSLLIVAIAGGAAFYVALRSTAEVIVVDEFGNPIFGAEVVPVSLSINYTPVFTDHDGSTRLPWVLQSIKWISVKKAGFQQYASVDIEQRHRIVVILKKAPISEGSAAPQRAAGPGLNKPVSGKD